MQMNRQKFTRPALLLMLASVILIPAFAVVENESSAQAQTAPVSNTPQATTPVPASNTAETAGTEKTASQPQAGIDTPDRPLETFNPTEKIDADSAVSFPVDI